MIIFFFLLILVDSFELNNAVWSCSWNPRCPYEIYGGLADGTIVILDLRYPSSRPLYKLEGLLEKRLPIHSLICLPSPLSIPAPAPFPPSSSASYRHPKQQQQQEQQHDPPPQIVSLDEPDSDSCQSEHATSSSYIFGATLAYPFRLDLGCLSQYSDLSITPTIEPLSRPSDEDYYCTSLHIDIETSYYMSSFRFQPKIVSSIIPPRPTLHSIGRIYHNSSMASPQTSTTATNNNTVVSTFEGPSNQVLLSRALLFSTSSSSLAELSARRLLAAISDESRCSLTLYEIDTHEMIEHGNSPRLFQNLPTTVLGSHENSTTMMAKGILDSCHIAHPYYGDFLAALTNTSRILLHRLQSV